MTEQEALAQMVAPGTVRPGKYRGGIIQVWVTRACDKSCFGCTQGSNLAGRPGFITPEQYDIALRSLKGYWGVVGMFGGNPALHPRFPELCEILKAHVPYEQRGIWCNHPKGHGRLMREVFNPAVSNVNVHLDKEAAAEFRRDWPEVRAFGANEDSRHSPPYVAMKDVVPEEWRRWDLIANCDINRHWSALVGVFRGEVRAWFCEVAAAQAMLHQDDPDYPDTGVPLPRNGGEWWKLPMGAFREQVRKHCHECGVPLRGYGELSQSPDGTEHTSAAHADVYKPKRPGRRVQVVTSLQEIGVGRIRRTTEYLQNARK